PVPGQPADRPEPARRSAGRPERRRQGENHLRPRRQGRRLRRPDAGDGRPARCRLPEDRPGRPGNGRPAMKHARRLPLWALSLIVVVGLHIALYYAALLWRPAVTPIQLEAAAMLVELEPLAPPQPTPPQPVVEPEPEPIPEVVEAPEPALAIVKPKPQVRSEEHT